MAELPQHEATTQVRVGHPTEQAGELVGRYKLLQVIGEGGFGSVWMAEQREPVRRRVALKIIKLGMDTKQVIARFEAERQALAMMDHPNIAKVLDAGATGAGRPFFVMELVKGVSILEYCDTEKLDTSARLLLFVDVCRAIQHAHQKGIIHRDIKPSNVLVTLHDGRAVPKVIDFGVAKATNAELTERTLFTEYRQIVGTPAYMSPEQAEMSGLDIDTRSDVYSLGVLLYELLTGTTPFDSDELLSKGYAEMMRIIREVEPHRPSTRVSSLGQTGTKIADRRRADPSRLGSLLKGDLDWIVMKCLEKDRTRRFDTPNSLADDVLRHVRGEPVEAAPPSVGYRMRKFVQRHRVRLLTSGAITALVVLLVASGLFVNAMHRRHLLDEQDKEKLRAAYERDVPSSDGMPEAEEDRLTRARFETTRISLDAKDKPLQAVLEEIAAKSGVPIRPDWTALDAKAIGPTINVSAGLRDMTAASVLNAVLSPMGDYERGPRYTIRDGAVLVSTDQAIRQNKVLATYDGSDILGNEKGMSRAAKQQSLKNLVTSIVDSNGWTDNGGDTSSFLWHEGKMVITTTPDNHRAISRLLRGIRQDTASLAPRMEAPVETLSPESVRVAQRLQHAKVAVDFVETPLDKALETIASSAQAQLSIDWQYLRRWHDKDSSLAVTLRASGCAADLVLDLLIRQVQAEWDLTDSGFIVGGSLPRKILTYDLGRGPGGVSGEAFRQVQEGIMHGIDSAYWAENGGDRASIHQFGGKMFISAPAITHVRVQQFLDALRSGKAPARADIPAKPVLSNDEAVKLAYEDLRQRRYASARAALNTVPAEQRDWKWNRLHERADQTERSFSIDVDDDGGYPGDAVMAAGATAEGTLLILTDSGFGAWRLQDGLRINWMQVPFSSDPALPVLDPSRSCAWQARWVQQESWELGLQALDAASSALGSPASVPVADTDHLERMMLSADGAHFLIKTEHQYQPEVKSVTTIRDVGPGGSSFTWALDDIKPLAVSSDGSFVVATRDHEHKFATVLLQRGVAEPVLSTDFATQAVFSPGNGKVALTGHQKGTLIDVAARTVAELPEAMSPAVPVSFDASGAQLLVGERDGTLYIWDTATLKRTHTLAGCLGVPLWVGWINGQPCAIAPDYTFRTWKLIRPATDTDRAEAHRLVEAQLASSADWSAAPAALTGKPVQVRAEGLDYLIEKWLSSQGRTDPPPASP